MSHWLSLAAWLTFHKNKEVEKLDIQKHFNISKLHNIKYYIDSIQSHGTVNRYNTKSTEQLHINLAKMGYLQVTKRSTWLYIKQMTVSVKPQGWEKFTLIPSEMYVKFDDLWWISDNLGKIDAIENINLWRNFQP